MLLSGGSRSGQGGNPAGTGPLPGAILGKIVYKLITFLKVVIEFMTTP
jgi:hypothetical protein